MQQSVDSEEASAVISAGLGLAGDFGTDPATPSAFNCCIALALEINLSTRRSSMIDCG